MPHYGSSEYYGPQDTPEFMPPFSDNLTGMPHATPQRLFLRAGSDSDLSSRAAISETGAVASTFDIVERRESIRPGTPVSSAASNDEKKGANDNDRSMRGSASTTSTGDVERDAGLVRMEKSSRRGDSVSQAEGEQEAYDPQEVHYQTMYWFHAGVIMIAETVSLGILSLPYALASIGFVPGVIFIISFGLMATYTGYVTYQVKMKHADITSFAHVLGLMFGKPGGRIGEVLQNLLLVFIMGAHINVFSVMMNTLTSHGLCTVVFMIIGAVVSFVVSMPRKFEANSKISIASCISIVTATIIAMISISLRGTGVGTAAAVAPSAVTSFSRGAMSTSSIILAYNGHIAYPSIIAEMKEPRDFPKALALLESVTITFYVIVAVVIYYYAGSGVESPALSSASPLIGKIAYGIALPTIIVAGVIAALVAAKQIYRHVWAKQPKVMKEKSFRARLSWYAILAALYLVAWIIAEAIPVFQQLLGVIGALFGTWFALGFCAMFWLWMNWKGSMKESYGVNWKKACLACLNVAIFAISAVICVLGMYGSIVAITQNEHTGMPFSCADNNNRL